MSIEHKRKNAFEGVPAKMKADGAAWIHDSYDDVQKTPINWDKLQAHPQWPAVRNWAHHFPSKVGAFRLMQTAIRIKSPLRITERLVPLTRRARIEMAPAAILERVARVLLTKDAFKRYVSPHIADIRHEFIEALSSGKLWHARWIVFRGYCQVLGPLVAALFLTARAVMKLIGFNKFAP